MPAPAHHKLSDLAAARIEELAGEGIACTPAEVVMLNALAWEIETPRHRAAMSRGVPVFVGPVALWPLTLAADEWWKAAMQRHKGDAEHMALLAFAMAHSRDQDVLDAITPKDALKAATRFVSKLRARPRELAEAIDQVLAQDDVLPRVKGPRDSDTGLTAGQIVTILCATVGGPPRLWESEVAVGYIREQMRAVSAQQAAECGGGLGDSDMVAATRQLGLYVMQIRERAKGSGNGSN
jgi:hypothetical protein